MEVHFVERFVQAVFFWKKEHMYESFLLRKKACTQRSKSYASSLRETICVGNPPDGELQCAIVA